MVDKERVEGTEQILSSSERMLKNDFVLASSLILQDEEVQIRQRRIVPNVDDQASSTYEIS